MPLVSPRFVRREKEIAESRFEVAQGESLRHRLRVQHLERELKEAQDSLNAERERMQVSLGCIGPLTHIFTKCGKLARGSGLPCTANPTDISES